MLRLKYKTFYFSEIFYKNFDKTFLIVEIFDFLENLLSN